MAKVLPELRAALEAAGRDPSTLEVVPFGTLPSEGKLDYYRSIGVAEVVLRVPAGDEDVVRRSLDEHAVFVEREAAG